MSVVDLLGFSLIVFVFALKPGPGVVFFSSIAVTDGIAAALITAVGTDIGHFFIVFVSLIAPGALHLAPAHLFIVQVVAAAYIGTVGIRYILADRNKLREPAKRKLPAGIERVLRGVVWSVSNPTNIAFYLAASPIWFAYETRLSVGDALMVALVAAVSFFAAQAFYTTFAKAAFGVFKNTFLTDRAFTIAGFAQVAVAIGLIAAGGFELANAWTAVP